MAAFFDKPAERIGTQDRLQQRDDLFYRIKNQIRLYIGIGQIRQLSLPAQNEDSVKTIVHTGFDIRVQAVSHDCSVIRRSTKDVQGIVDDFLIRFSDDPVRHASG